MRALSLVMPYYCNPGMLAEQYRVWAVYPQDVKQRLEVVLVDDGSPDELRAVHVPRPEGLPALSIYRALEDKPWHQHGARNLGAYQARGPWLLLTDMDHVLPAASMRALLLLQHKARIYTLARYDAPDELPTIGRYGEHKPHPNTFVMTRDLFWHIGGYDEDYCGVYGTDGLFRQRAYLLAPVQHLSHVRILRYPRDVIKDASTTTLARKEGRDPEAKAKVREWKLQHGRENKVATLEFEWTRDL